MGLATRSSDESSNGWILDENMSTGKWHYPADRREFFIASIPLLSAITRSATNVDMCDRHFQCSYLIKYISGKDERRLIIDLRHKTDR